MHTVAAIILAVCLTFTAADDWEHKSTLTTKEKERIVVMERKVDELYTDYTNRAARVEAARARREANAAKRDAAKRDAVQTVRDNLKKRKGAAAVKAAVKKGGK